jgi:elongation factor P
VRAKLGGGSVHRPPITFFKLQKIMGIIASEIRRGMTLLFDGEPVRVLDFHHHTPGNLRAMVQTKLRKLRTGTQFEHRFRSTDTVDTADLETHQLEYLYSGGDSYHFMNTENFDQLEMSGDDLGDAAKWMTGGMKMIAEFFNGRPIGIQLPNALVYEVVETAPVMKTATKNASTKPAKLENGVSVNVPEFVQTGEKVRVNPNTGEYLDRVK